MIKSMLRLESLAIFGLSLYFYNYIGESWWLYFGLWLIPDATMAGYLGGNKVGAYLYNSSHSYYAPSLLLMLGSINTSNLAMAIAVIWFSHISLDRTLGYGLKLEKGFKHTHLGKL